MAFDPLGKGTKVHGSGFPKESLTKNMDFFTIRTTLDITIDTTGSAPFFGGNDPADASQARFDKMVETVSLRSQPVILGDVVVTVETAPVADLPATSALSSGSSVSVFTIRFANEHEAAWSAETLSEALDGIEDFVFDSVTPTDNNVAITRTELL